ncbi:MAG: Yip1 family protein [Candidatus Altiarchaeota archaeon]
MTRGVEVVLIASLFAAFALPLMMLATGSPLVIVGLMFIFCLVGYPIMGLIASFIFAGGEYLVARILGGRCTFTELYYMMASVYFPVYILIAAVVQPLIQGILERVISPVFGMGAIVVSYIPHIFSFYLLTLILRQTCRMSAIKAVLCWLIPGGMLFGASIFFLLAFSSVTGLSPLNPTEVVRVDGFDRLAIAPISFFGSSEPDKSVFTLVFGGEEGELDGSTLKISKNGVDCRITNLMMDGVDMDPPQNQGITGGRGYGDMMPEGTFLDQDLAEKPVVRFTKTMVFQLNGMASGPGCGGVKGGEYDYAVSFDAEGNGTQWQDKGIISGRYLDKEARLEFEAGYGTAGKNIRYRITGL